MSDDLLRELGKQLPWDRPDAERRETLRSSLLVAAAEGDRGTARRWVLVGGGFAAGALAAAAVVLLLVRTNHDDASTPRQAYARIDAPATAQLEHTVTATARGTDELIRVRAGTVRVAVPEVRAGNRVRMKTADAEVEGSGIYEVVVTADALSRVTVTTGTARLSVDVDGVQKAVFLSAGQTWRSTIYTAELDLPAQPTEPSTATEDTATPAPLAKTDVTGDSPVTDPTPAGATATTRTTPQAPTAAAPADIMRSRATTAKATPSGEAAVTTTAQPGNENASSSDPPRMPAVTTLTPVESKPAPPPSTTEVRFQAGYALLREGKVRQAAVELGAAADAGGDDPLAADARYFQAIALVRSGQKPEAERVLIAFLDRAKQTMRRGRAAMLLGRLVADRGDTASAVSWFKSALDDPDPSIAASARDAIEALER